ncbi:hypothetical protein AB4J85_16940 [Pseudomonas aeruginosa]|uniref:hypothetical protein n=1 Tax=Pseudomonas aeruginosa TaxID=287 RepID=UPI0031E2E785
MSKHTKGPWKSQHDKYATWAGDQRWISVTAPKRGEIGRFKRESDAVLAASAPDLLDALEDAVNRLTSSLILLKCDDDFIKKEIAKARAAIAKATA